MPSIKEEKAKSPTKADDKLKKVPNVVASKEPVMNKTKIAARLEAAAKGVIKVKRSSDLVPLSHEYEVMRKRLRALLAGAKEYHASVEKLNRARMDVSTYTT
jgi:predicted nucleic acid-binding Zn ribbon protein